MTNNTVQTATDLSLQNIVASDQAAQTATILYVASHYENLPIQI